MPVHLGKRSIRTRGLLHDRQPQGMDCSRQSICISAIPGGQMRLPSLPGRCTGCTSVVEHMDVRERLYYSVSCKRPLVLMRNQNLPITLDDLVFGTLNLASMAEARQRDRTKYFRHSPFAFVSRMIPDRKDKYTVYLKTVSQEWRKSCRTSRTDRWVRKPV